LELCGFPAPARSRSRPLRQIWTPLGRPARTGRIRTLFRGPRTAPSSFGNVLVPRELRSPANDWGRTPVVCGRSTFWTENAVLDAHSRPLCAVGTPDRTAPAPRRHHEARELSLREQSPAPQPPQTSQTPHPSGASARTVRPGRACAYIRTATYAPGEADGRRPANRLLLNPAAQGPPEQQHRPL